MAAYDFPVLELRDDNGGIRNWRMNVRSSGETGGFKLYACGGLERKSCTGVRPRTEEFHDGSTEKLEATGVLERRKGKRTAGAHIYSWSVEAL